MNEFVEVALSSPNASGFTAIDYAIVLYNGSNGAAYSATGVTGTGTPNPITGGTTTGPFPIAGSTSMITLYTLSLAGIQNGAPDGIALVNTSNNTVEQFLSYEGTFTATSGIASGTTSTDVGVSEDGTAAGTSLSASGFGVNANDFGPSSFILADTATPGAMNQGQVFAVPEPSSLMAGLLGGLVLLRRRR